MNRHLDVFLPCGRKVFDIVLFEEKFSSRVHAAGICLFKKDENGIKILFQYKNNLYEDLGGKINHKDNDIFDTVIREAAEESNNLIIIEKERIKTSKLYYNKPAKYLSMVLEANLKESLFVAENFGKKETCDNINRTIEWIPLEDLDIVYFHPRISKENITSIIKDLTDLNNMSNPIESLKDLTDLNTMSNPVESLKELTDLNTMSNTIENLKDRDELNDLSDPVERIRQRIDSVKQQINEVNQDIKKLNKSIPDLPSVITFTIDNITEAEQEDDKMHESFRNTFLSS